MDSRVLEDRTAGDGRWLRAQLRRQQPAGTRPGPPLAATKNSVPRAVSQIHHEQALSNRADVRLRTFENADSARSAYRGTLRRAADSEHVVSTTERTIESQCARSRASQIRNACSARGSKRTGSRRLPVAKAPRSAAKPRNGSGVVAAVMKLLTAAVPSAGWIAGRLGWRGCCRRTRCHQESRPTAANGAVASSDSAGLRLAGTRSATTRAEVSPADTERSRHLVRAARRHPRMLFPALRE